MINRLINMEVPTISNIENFNSDESQITYSIKDYANAFIQGMGEKQRQRFKIMLESGIKCGMSIADNYNVDYREFIEEVKKQMGVKSDA